MHVPKTQRQPPPTEPLAASVIYLGERINRLAGAHWRSFATQPYFDANGTFFAAVVAAPLVLTLFTVLVRRWVARGAGCLRAGFVVLNFLCLFDVQREAARFCLLARWVGALFSHCVLVAFFTPTSATQPDPLPAPSGGGDGGGEEGAVEAQRGAAAEAAAAAAARGRSGGRETGCRQQKGQVILRASV